MCSSDLAIGVAPAAGGRGVVDLQRGQAQRGEADGDVARGELQTALEALYGGSVLITPTTTLAHLTALPVLAQYPLEIISLKHSTVDRVLPTRMVASG